MWYENLTELKTELKPVEKYKMFRNKGLLNNNKKL